MDKIEETEEYDMLENELSEFKNQLGNSFNERMINMIEICKYECGINIDNKKNNTSYTTKDGKFFTVHCAYKSSLDGYSKKLFDPFCRSQNFGYTVPGTSHEIQTTLAQLNFIKWCIKNNIIDYISDNRSFLFNKQLT